MQHFARQAAVLELAKEKVVKLMAEMTASQE
jgi:hypothetical protein